MSTIYINTRQSEEHRIVIVKDGTLTGFEQDIVGWENRKGDIYKAVVTRIEEGLDAAFVNFGESKNGFLPLKYVSQNLPGASGGERKLAEGDSVLVQIKKDHVGDKGAGMTTSISLAGCYLVLMPNTKKDKALISKNTGGRGDRQKTATALTQLEVPEGMSVIVRTAGVGRSTEDLRWDLESYLLKLWRAVEAAAQSNRGPVLIYRENNLILRAVRDYYHPGEDQIYCDDADTCGELKSFMELISPENADCVHYYEGTGAMVPDAVEQQIDAIYKREIKTVSGARVVFDVTEAMVTVDVNSGQMRGHSDIEATALRANLDAAEVVARHLRLRDMSGLIVVDFIDMMPESNRQKLEEYFIGLLRKDRARVQWTPLSRFGMMELSRQRLSRPVEESQSVVCQTCRGTGRQRRPESFALRLLRQIRAMLPDEDVDAMVVQAPADTAVYLLNEKRMELRRLEEEYNCEILIAPLADMYPPDFSIRKIKNEARIGTSYQALGGNSSEKVRAEEMRRRFEKRSAGTKTALIQTVMPEERVVESAGGVFGGLWKSLCGVFAASASAEAENSAPPQSNNNRKRSGSRRGGGGGGGAAKQNPQQQSRGGSRDNAAPKDVAAAADSPAAESGDAGSAGSAHKRSRGGKRRRSGVARKVKSETETETALQGDSQSPQNTPADSAAPTKSDSSSSANAESAASADTSKSPAVEAKTSAPVDAAESAPSKSKSAAGTPAVAAQANDDKSRAADSSANENAALVAANGGGESAQTDGDNDDPSSETLMPLTARLARRYGKSEAEIHTAMTATGDAGSECMGEIPPALTARLDAYFTQQKAAPKTPKAPKAPKTPPVVVPPVIDESLRKVESAGGADDSPAEFQQQVHELTEEGGDEKRPPAAAESPALKQVETVSNDIR